MIKPIIIYQKKKLIFWQKYILVIGREADYVTNVGGLRFYIFTFVYSYFLYKYKK